MQILRGLYACPTCGKLYCSKYTMQRHADTHNNDKPYKCRYCDKSFALKQYLKDHVNVHTGDLPYKCPVAGCSRAFNQAGRLSTHKKEHFACNTRAKYCLFKV